MAANNQEYKADDGKPLAGCLFEFGDAFLAMSRVSTFGAIQKGYGRGTWKRVELIRYIDAFGRHIQKMGPNLDRIDPESGLPHRSHALWNLAAICQLMEEGVTTGQFEQKPEKRSVFSEILKWHFRIVGKLFSRRKAEESKKEAPSWQEVLERNATTNKWVWTYGQHSND